MSASEEVEELEGLSCEERALGLSSLEKKRLNFDFVALCSCLRRGHGEGSADLFSLESSDRMHENGSKMQQRRFRLNIRKFCFLARGRSNTGTGFLEGCLMARDCHCLRGIWTRTINKVFQFLVIPEMVRQSR